VLDQDHRIGLDTKHLDPVRSIAPLRRRRG